MLLEFKLMEETVKGLGDSFEKNFIMNLQATDYAMKVYKGKIKNAVPFSKTNILKFDDENMIKGRTAVNWKFNIPKTQASRIFNKARLDFMPLYAYICKPEWVDGLATVIFDFENNCEVYRIKKDNCFEDIVTEKEFNIINTLNTLKRQYTDILYRAVCDGKLYLKDISMENKLRDRDIPQIGSKPTKENLDEVKRIIDEIIEKDSNCGYPYEDGSGRTVCFIKGFAVKFPNKNDNQLCSGEAQNLKEAEVYFKSKHESLVPIHTVYKGCLICREVIDSYDIEEITGLHYKEIDKLIEIELDKMKDIIEEFNLDINDIKTPRNWGFDTIDYTFKCMDYGYEK